MAITNAGAIAAAQCLINDSATSVFFNNTNAYLGVGDSSTAFAAGQTDLQAATNKTRKAMDASYPTRSSGAITWRSTFNSGEANWAWQEWGVFNASSSGTMFSRKVESLGTKTNTQTWVLTATVTVAAA
jgi:hypothetical protein